MGKFFNWKGTDVNEVQQGPTDTFSATPINQGGSTLAAGATLTADVDVTGYRTIKILAQIGNATTPATANTDVNAYLLPYLADGVTPNALSLASVRSSVSINAGFAYKTVEYEIAGFSKVRLNLNNANVAALQGAKLCYFLST